MTVVQGSLLTHLQELEEEDAETAVRPPAADVERLALEQGAWLEVQYGWLAPAAAAGLLGRLVAGVAWRADRRRMYDRVVDVPRLVAFYDGTSALPDPLLVAARDVLSERYRGEQGGPLCTAGLCLYRDGRDSVAWHGDTNGRGATDDTVVAVLSLGARRRLLLRPRGGGASRRVEVGEGDLLVMGGSCQRTWEHSVPKTSRPVGARISVQFRQAGVS